MPAHPLIAYQKRQNGQKRLPTDKTHAFSFPFTFRRVPRKALIDFTRSFAMMIRAKLRLTHALETAIKQCEHETFKRTLIDVKKQIEEGQSLAGSFERHNHVFDSLYVSLVRVGEAAGILDTVFLRIATYHEKSEELRRKVRQAMAYPVVVLIVAMTATTFLLTSIVPTFAQMFADFDAELPAPTRLILGLSAGITENLFMILIFSTGIAGVIYWGRSRPGIRLWIDRHKLIFPLAGKLVTKNLAARFCRTLGTLLESGVSLVPALEMLGKATGNRYLDQEISTTTRRVKQGKRLSEEVDKIGLFPELVIQLMLVGEKTAELDQMLIHAAEYYELEVDAVLESVSSILEPILIVLIGLIMGAILVALYLPMFDLVNIVN